MKVRVYAAIVDHGDGSHGVSLFLSEQELRDKLQLDDDDFAPGYDVPVEIDYDDIELVANNSQ